VVIQVAPGLFYRHLSLDQVLARQRARHIREVAQHNAEVTAPAEPRPPTRDQVLEEFRQSRKRL